MSGSNTMCVATVLLETGTLPMQEPITKLILEAPAGLVQVRADCAKGKVMRVTIQNVPAFATHLDAPLEVPGVGTLSVDVAFGGVFYVLADSEHLGLRLVPEEGADIVRLALEVLGAAREQLRVAHPENPAADHIFSTLFYGPPKLPGNHGRNAVVLSHGAIDRCPCGTGTSARMAVLHARGQLEIGQEFAHEGVLDTVFTGRIVREARVGALAAVVSEVSGRAWITSHARYVLDPDDPFPEGFTVGDIWPAHYGASATPPLSVSMP
jgi:proline racemase